MAEGFIVTATTEGGEYRCSRGEYETYVELVASGKHNYVAWCPIVADFDRTLGRSREVYITAGLGSIFPPSQLLND
jgi:hypothetical protein